MDVLSPRARKGRGAVGNATGRFEPRTTHAVDDGWTDADADPPPLRTFVTEERPKTIISRNTSPDISFDQSINPYRGCEHGCVYCYARPTHAYHGLSPGLDFESRLFAKPDAAQRLEKELRRPGYQPKTIMIGANTDAYQPIERARRITRSVLEVLAEYRHPVMLATKSALVLRDLDILAPMAAKGLAAVAVSLTTLDRDLARRMEPRAATPGRRLEAMRGLAEAGVPVTVLAAPMIPALNDHEVEAILEAAAAAGATGADYVLLRLPLEIKTLFGDWLETHRPDRAKRVMNRLREARNGALYVSEFGERMRGKGQHADLLAKRFQLACDRLGLNRGWAARPGLETRRFRLPSRPGDQMALF